MKRYAKAEEMRKNGKTIILDTFYLTNLFHTNAECDHDANSMYEETVQLLTKQFRFPDLIIYCTDSIDFLFRRIQKRSMSYDKTTTKECIEDLIRVHETWIRKNKSLPLYCIQSRELEVPKEEEKHLRAIRHMLIS